MRKSDAISLLSWLDELQRLKERHRKGLLTRREQFRYQELLERMREYLETRRQQREEAAKLKSEPFVPDSFSTLPSYVVRSSPEQAPDSKQSALSEGSWEALYASGSWSVGSFEQLHVPETLSDLFARVESPQGELKPVKSK